MDERLKEAFEAHKDNEHVKAFLTFQRINDFLKAWDNGDINDDQKEMIRAHIAPRPCCESFDGVRDIIEKVPIPACESVRRISIQQTRDVAEEFMKLSPLTNKKI